MTTNDDTAILILNEVLMASRDAEQGYQTAADAVAVPDLVELFEEVALERRKFAGDIEERLRALRATPVKGGTPVGAIHRAWMNLKTALETNETQALLLECERADELTIKVYAAALRETDLDVQTRTLVQQQYERVQLAYDRIRQLRGSATYAHS